MTRWWKRLVGTILALSVAVPALAVTTWVVASDSDCTGFNAATGLSTGPIQCCRATAAGGGNVCNQKLNMGDKFIRPVTLTAGTGSTYTATGDALNAAALARIGLTNVVYVTCSGTSTGQDVNFNLTAPTGGATWGAKIQLFQTGGGGTTPVTNGGEYAGSTANASIQCVLTGY